MALQSPSAQLERLRRKVEAIASPNFQREIRASLAEETRKLVVEGFSASESPEGRQWAPLKAGPGSRRYGGRPLLDTGRLRNSIVVRPTTTGIRAAVTNVVYAATHQYGRGNIPARPFFPTGRLPERWAQAFHRVIDGAMKRRANG